MGVPGIERSSSIWQYLYLLSQLTGPKVTSCLQTTTNINIAYVPFGEPMSPLFILSKCPPGFTIS